MNDKSLDAARPAVGVARNRPALYVYLATSEEFIPRCVRSLRKSIRQFSVPAPRIIVRPILWVYLIWRSCYYYCLRIFFCEPLFKAYCKQVGKQLRTGCFLHWVQGKGDIILGDNVVMDGKIEITFAARFSERPTLQIGNNTGVGHGCTFIVGKRITVGNYCTLSGNIRIFDSNGHSADPTERMARLPPAGDDVRPVTIGDNVWIGQHSLIFPGVRIGRGSVISAGSVVRSHVPEFSVVAGNPAKIMFRLKKPDPAAPAAAQGNGV